jgi:integrase
MPVYQKRSKGKAVRNRWRIRVCALGLQHEKVFDGTKKEAEAAEARWRLELEAASPADSRIAPPFSRFSLGRYRIHAENHLKSGTWRNRKYQIATLVEFFGETRLTKITAAMVEQFQHLRLTQVGPVKVNDDVKVLKRILSYARSQGIPAAEPNVKRLPERTTKGRVLVWSADEVKSLYRAFQAESPALLPMTVCMLNTGLRKGEVLAMEWSAVDLDRGLLLIYPSADWQPKNGQPREVPIGSALRPWLEPPANPARWVFPSSKGQRYASWPQRQWDRARAASGVGGSPHVCRHTYASHFLASCPDLYLLAQILGHSHTRVTELYSHLLPHHLERARDAVVLPVPPTTVSPSTALDLPREARSSRQSQAVAGPR